jgi:hypothetical protein
MELGKSPSTNSGPSTGAGTASIGSDCCSGGAAPGIHFGALHGLDENRRVCFGRWFLLLHLNPHDGTGMQHNGKNKCCDDCPFARRFVHRCRWDNASALRSVSCWRSQYPDHVSIRTYLRTLQCCNLHISFRTRGVNISRRMQPYALHLIRIRL